MSFHILHVFQHGATLAKEQRFIVCRALDKKERRLPHEDMRAVIIAARGVAEQASKIAPEESDVFLTYTGMLAAVGEHEWVAALTRPRLGGAHISHLVRAKAEARTDGRMRPLDGLHAPVFRARGERGVLQFRSVFELSDPA